MARTGKIVQARPYGPAELDEDLAALQLRYPELQRQPAGASVMGKRLELLRIGRGSRHVHLNASFHANEWITSLALMRWTEELLERRAAGVDPADGLSLWLLPMVNPDGVELALRGVPEGHPYGRQLLEWNRGSADFSGWKANIRGVDLNDQFPAHWDEERRRRGMEGPGPRDYPGESPLSEPEARAAAALTERESFDVVAALHTQGEEIYWNYRGWSRPARGAWPSGSPALRAMRPSSWRAATPATRTGSSSASAGRASRSSSAAARTRCRWSSRTTLWRVCVLCWRSCCGWPARRMDRRGSGERIAGRWIAACRTAGCRLPPRNGRACGLSFSFRNLGESLFV